MKSSRVSLCWESRERSVGVGQDAGGLQWVRWRAELEVWRWSAACRQAVCRGGAGAAFIWLVRIVNVDPMKVSSGCKSRRLYGGAAFCFIYSTRCPKLQNRGCKASRSPEDVWDSSLVMILLPRIDPGAALVLHFYWARYFLRSLEICVERVNRQRDAAAGWRRGVPEI